MIESTGNKQVIGAELAVSALLSSLVRRNVCPNFVTTRGVFTCQYEPPSKLWGCEDNKRPMGGQYSAPRRRPKLPAEPGSTHRGRYQYMRMELCSEGDAEEYLKRQPNTLVSTEVAVGIVFQVAFALYVAAEKFHMKHYDMKLLNIFLQSVTASSDGGGATVLRYGVGSSIFALRLAGNDALIAKVADYGTAVTTASSNGAPATIGQFTTLENTPPEFLILGDAAKQGHGHDAFGLGLCMFHLFTGNAPYEEILEDVVCPPNLKKELEAIWTGSSSTGYDVIQSVILADVDYDDDGTIIEGEPDGTLYDTLYRFLVLFGIPERDFGTKDSARVWNAIRSCLEGKTNSNSGTNNSNNSNTITKTGKGRSRKKVKNDKTQFHRDRDVYSLDEGSNQYVKRARERLRSVDGAWEALRSLIDFNPDNRTTAIGLLNSRMMQGFSEDHDAEYSQNDSVMSFMAYHSTQGQS